MAKTTWFITGAGSGLGYVLTELLLAKGERVAATTRQQFEGLNALKLRYGDQLWLSELDVTDVPAIARVVDAAFKALGTIDVVVSNAGYVLLGALEELSHEQIHQQINTNLMGPIFLLKAFLPYLRDQGHGRIFQMSSEAGQMTYPALSIYHATKWGVEGFCESLAREVAVFNIQVTIVEPGRTQTQFDENAVMPIVFNREYQKSTVGNYRRLLAMGKFPNIGDAHRVAQRIILTNDQTQLPLRLTLGSDAYTNISKALNERLRLLNTQKESAYSTDITLKEND